MRSIRLAALTCAAIAALVALEPSTAHADEGEPGAASAPAPASAGSRAFVRKLLVDGDFAAARRYLDRLRARDEGAEGRAPDGDLLFVLETWRAAGGRPPANASYATPEAAPPESDWERRFVVAREVLAVGGYADAARRLDTLAADAPDAVASARALELRALAWEALARDERGRAVVVVPREGAPRRSAPAPDGPHPTETVWYGWQTLLSDGAALATTPIVPWLGVTTYLLGAPLVHAAHGRPIVSLASVGLRVGTPLVGAVGGVLLSSGCGRDLCGLGYAAVGAAVGAGGAVLLDAFALAREAAEPAREGRPSAMRPSLAARREGGFDVGLSGTF